MRSLTVNEMQFQIKDAAEAGIVAGMVLDEAAAKTLYQTRVENLGNNLRARVKKMVEEGKGPDEIQAAVTEYDNAYNFSMPGAGRKPVDPLEKECRALAIEHIRGKLAEQNRKYSDVKKEKPDQLEAQIERFMEHPEIVKLAKKRLADKRKAGESDLQLDL